MIFLLDWRNERRRREQKRGAKEQVRYCPAETGAMDLENRLRGNKYCIAHLAHIALRGNSYFARKGTNVIVWFADSLNRSGEDMNGRSMNYNLLDEKWIPVLYRDGAWDRVGIRKALEDAARIRQVAASNPMDRLAILRFLLTLLYWCRGNPPEDAGGEAVEAFPSDWFSKLDANRDCFNLLGEGKRFYQNSAYRRIKAEHTTNYLIHEVPSGTNKWHFRHSTDKMNGLCPACCAMGLIRLPVFATSAGKGMTYDSGKSPGINSKPPLYVLQIGTSLAATLRLSWNKAKLETGTPEWETPNMQLPKTGEVPLLTGMTWLPRSVWLSDPKEHESECISCGRTERLIWRCVFDGKGSSKAEARIWRDPHVLYSPSGKREVTSLRASDALGAADAAAGQWARIMGGLLESSVISSTGGSIWIVGFSTVQNDKYLEAVERVIPLRSPPDQLQESIEKVQRWQQKARGLGRRLIPPKEKKASRKHKEIAPMLSAIRPHVEGKVSAKVGELLAGNDDAWEDAASEYRPMMWKVARSLSPGFTTAAVQRRKQIARVAPDMRPRAEPDKRPKRKKGGDK